LTAASCDEFESKMRSTVRKLEELKRECSSTDDTKDLDYYIYRLNAMCTLSANGYFSVNRSLITGITATTATYFFLLMQFRLSEK